MNNCDIVDFEFLIDKNEIHITFRKKSNLMLLTYPSKPAPDEIFKSIYGVVDGKITFIDGKHGKHIPQQIIPERFEFPE